MPHSVRLRFRWLAASVITLIIVGAFLAWGPIGIGNGPLWVPTASGGEYGWSQQQTAPVAYVLPIGNHGQEPAVIDGVTITSRHAYMAPAVRKVLIGRMTKFGCTALGPFGGAHTALAGCVLPDLHVAVGSTIPAGTYLASGNPVKHQPALVLELVGPGPQRCWIITSITIRYHVGIRYYSATFPQGNVVTCGAGARAFGLS